MAIPTVRTVQDACVVPVNLTDGAREGIVSVRANDQVDMVPHQAVGPELEPVPLSDAGKEAKIVLAVDGRDEDVAAAVSAMGHMVRQARDDDSRSAWHYPVKT